MPKSSNQKSRISAVALRLFATRGYASTPISLIAKSAGVSQGLMYNFFPGKEALLRDIMAQGIADIMASLKSYHDIRDPADAIRGHVMATITIVERRKTFWKLLHAVRLQGLVLDAVEDQFLQVTQEVTAIFTRVFRQLHYPNPNLEAILFLAQIDGLVILYLQNEKIPLKKLAQQLIKRYTK